MATSLFPQPPDNEPDLINWRKDLHEKVFGQENAGGTLNGDNITNITDPGDTSDVSDLATRFNNLLAELRTLGLM
jgi:hypothetical protein